MDPETIKTFAPFVPLTVPFINAFVETRIKPKLKKMADEGQIDAQLIEHSITNKFEEYIVRSVDRHSYVTTVVFQNQRKRLEDLYLPLTIERTLQNNATEVISIDSYPDDLIPKHQRVLLTDTAGMGKSTIMRFLFLACIRENQGIPIFIELRHLSEQKSVIDVIRNDLSSIDTPIDEAFILKLVKRGDFVFFLDGYDEIPFSEREEVTRQLQSFISKAQENHFILTSRPESALASFSDFQEFRVQPLNSEEAFALIRKYGQGSEIVDQLIKKLEDQMDDVGEFLTNPLLVSLLYKAYSYKQTVPQKKHIFYRQVYAALFETHDLSKPGAFTREKRSGLDIDDFDSVLRVLGYLTAGKGKVEYEKDELLRYIDTARNYCAGIVFQSTDFLSDLVSAVPLFVRDGLHFRWNHKSIQEYFAASYICRDAKGKQADILRAMVSSGRSQLYFNVLDLCYDIDYKTFRDTVIFDLLKDFITFYDSSYSEIDRSLIPEEHIHLRKQLCFRRQSIVFSSDFINQHCESTTPKDSVEFVQEEIVRRGFAQKVEIATGSFIGPEGGLIAIGKESLLLNVLRRKQRDLIDLIEPIIVETSVKTLTLPDGETIEHPFERTNNPDDVCSGEPFMIDDNPDAPWNSAENFLKVNSVLTYVGHDVLNLRHCRELLHEIETDLEQEQQFDPLSSLG